MTSINQKEYLKRYLGLGKEKKKKKKKDKVTVKTVKIIDDNDFDTDKAIQEDLNAVDEDAPQIVAVIDERPPSLRVDEQRNKLWIPLGQTETEEVKTTGFNFRIKKEKDEGSTRKRRTLQDLSPPRGGVVIKTEPGLSPENEDLSLTRRSRNEDLSPPRSNRTEDLSPPRRKRTEDLSPPRRNRTEDLSPPRRKRTEDLSPPRRNRTEDLSPPQRRKNEDLSPPRRNRTEDLSPPSRTTNKDLSPRRNKNNDLSPPRRIKTEDLSPPRRKRQDSDGDLSPPRKRKPDTTDLSPPRRKRLNSSGDLSPPRRRTEDLSPPRRKERDLSPPRRKQTDLSPPRRKKSRWAESSSPPPTIKIEDASPPRQQSESSPRRKDKKMFKTLDGKKAGLQNAVELMKETVAMKKREEEMFRNMSAEVSGANAKTVVRNRKPVDKEEEARKEMKEREMKEKYSKWGKGIKQVDDHNERLQQELYEMSKPLARYADDEDLERYLKEQEREGDPMLAYIRKKKKKVAVEAGIPSKPEYMGEFMPNRFGIRPGYRWDGVDRSNGYEKKWFDVQNSKKASLEESYKWNVEDM